LLVVGVCPDLREPAGQGMDGIDEVRARILAQVAGAADEAALEDLRVAALGKKGEISAMMRALGGMSDDERRTAGPALNALKTDVTAATASGRAARADAARDERLKSEWLDVTLPGRPRPAGTIHPVGQVTDEVIAICADLGYSVAEGPQVETDWYN